MVSPTAMGGTESSSVSYPKNERMASSVYFHLCREVETVVADSRPAFSNMGGERGIGSQQELVGETPEDVVIGVDDDELRKVAAQRVARGRRILPGSGPPLPGCNGDLSASPSPDRSCPGSGRSGRGRNRKAARRSWSTGIPRANSLPANSRRLSVWRLPGHRPPTANRPRSAAVW